MRKSLLNFLLTALSAASFASCVEPIDLDTGEDSQVVVNCILTEDDVQTLEMYYTSSTLDGERRPVEDAEVILRRGYGEAGKFSYEEGGVWKCDYRPGYGNQYNLLIKTGDKVITASTTFPDDVSVSCFGRRRDIGEGRRKISYLMYSYELRIFDRTPECPPYIGYEYHQASRLWVFPKDMGWGEEYQKYIASSHFCTDDFNLTSLTVSDLPCFSADSIKAMPSWLREQLGWYPLKLGDLRMHQGFVRMDIPAGYSSGQTHEELLYSPIYSDMSFALVRPFPTYWIGYDGPYQEWGGLYDIYILSDEADQYFKDVYRKHLNKDNFLFEYDTENIYTNVTGGVGLFGAMIHRNNRVGGRGYYPDFILYDEETE